MIAPSIDADDEDMNSVEKLFAEIRSRYPSYHAALLHGRLPAEEKTAVIADFASGMVQILVSTIVIEVGIDVPEATMIIIENCQNSIISRLCCIQSNWLR